MGLFCNYLFISEINLYSIQIRQPKGGQTPDFVHEWTAKSFKSELSRPAPDPSGKGEMRPEWG